MIFDLVISCLAKVTLYSLSCLCVGIWLVRLIGVRPSESEGLSATAIIALSFLFGSGVLSNVWLLACVFGLFRMWLITIVLLACIISGLAPVWKLRNDLILQLMQTWKFFRLDYCVWKTMIFLTLVIGLQTGIACFLPLQVNSDAAAFYMVISKLLAGTGKLVSLGGYEAFSSIGMQGEFHFAALMSLGCEWGSKLFSWPISIACGLILVGIAGQCDVGTRGQWLAIAMFYTSTAVIALIGDGKVDLFGAAMGLAAFYCCLQVEPGVKRSMHFLGGIFTGFSVVAKISYLPIIIPSITLFVIWRHLSSCELRFGRFTDFKKISVNLLLILVGFSLPILMHFLKNGIMSGEPFAPFVFLKSDFGDREWINQAWFSVDVTRKIILTYPLALIYGKYPMQQGTLSVMILAFIPLLLFVPRTAQFWKSKMVQITMTGVLGVVLWVLIRPSVFAPRYILYTLLLLIPVAAYSAEFVSMKEPKPRVLTSIIAIVSVCYLLGSNAVFADHLVKGMTEKDGALLRASEKLNDAAGKGDRVLCFNYFTYWFRVDLLEKLSTSEEKRLLESGFGENGQEIWEGFYSRGFRFVFIDQKTHRAQASKLNPSKSPGWLVVKTIFQEDQLIVYQLSEKR